MDPQLRPLSTDKTLVRKLAGDMEAAHDMDCADGVCECNRSDPSHKARAERGRALIEARNRAE